MKGEVYWKLIPLARSLSSFSFFHLLAAINKVKAVSITFPNKRTRKTMESKVYTETLCNHFETSPPVKKPVLCTLPSNLWCLEKNQPHLHKKSNSPYRTRWWSGCRDLIPVCLLLLMMLRSCCLVGQLFTLCVGDRNLKKGIYSYCLSWFHLRICWRSQRSDCCFQCQQRCSASRWSGRRQPRRRGLGRRFWFGWKLAEVNNSKKVSLVSNVEIRHIQWWISLGLDNNVSPLGVGDACFF